MKPQLSWGFRRFRGELKRPLRIPGDLAILACQCQLFADRNQCMGLRQLYLPLQEIPSCRLQPVQASSRVELSADLDGIDRRLTHLFKVFLFHGVDAMSAQIHRVGSRMTATIS